MAKNEVIRFYVFLRQKMKILHFSANYRKAVKNDK